MFSSVLSRFQQANPAGRVGGWSKSGNCFSLPICLSVCLSFPPPPPFSQSNRMFPPLRWTGHSELHS